MTVDYLPVASGSSANVETQAEYETDLSPGGVLEDGYKTGIVKSNRFNKTLRQTTMASAAFANFIAEVLDVDVLDDGNIASLIERFTQAVRELPQTATGASAARLIASKFSDVYDSSDFGIPYDGVTDAAAAFNAAGDEIADFQTAPNIKAYATLRLHPGVMWIESQTTKWHPFINYVGTRATTANATPGPVYDYSSSRGTIMRASPLLYINTPAGDGTLGFISTGDITLKAITFVGARAINTNSSVGLQLGSAGGTANTGRPFESTDVGTTVSSCKLDECRFYAFSEAIRAYTLGQGIFTSCGWEACIKNFVWYYNSHWLPVPAAQSAEFVECEMYNHAFGFDFGNNVVGVKIVFMGGFMRASADGNIHVNYAASGTPFDITFIGTDFYHGSDVNTYHLKFAGNYDGVTTRLLCSGCTFQNGMIGVTKITGASDLEDWEFISCTSIGTDWTFLFAAFGTIRGGRIEQGVLAFGSGGSGAVKDTTIEGVNFKNNASAINVAVAGCARNTFRSNRFQDVTTPIAVFDDATNDSILFENNRGVTVSPTRGIIIDNLGQIAFANIGTPANGSIIYCADATQANPPAGAGGGAYLRRIAGAWHGAA